MLGYLYEKIINNNSFDYFSVGRGSWSNVFK